MCVREGQMDYDIWGKAEASSGFCNQAAFSLGRVPVLASLPTPFSLSLSSTWGPS